MIDDILGAVLMLGLLWIVVLLARPNRRNKGMPTQFYRCIHGVDTRGVYTCRQCAMDMHNEEGG